MKHTIETGPCSGHLPETKSIPWSTPAASDRTFKSVEELRTTYLEQEGVDSNGSTIAYRRIPGMHQIIE